MDTFVSLASVDAGLEEGRSVDGTAVTDTAFSIGTVPVTLAPAGIVPAE